MAREYRTTPNAPFDPFARVDAASYVLKDGEAVTADGSKARTDAPQRDPRAEMLARNRVAWKADREKGVTAEAVVDEDRALSTAIPDPRERMLARNAVASRADGLSLAEYRREVILAAARRWRR